MEIDYIKIIYDAIPAFAGALFAFIFIRISDRLKTKSNFKLNNLKALVKIQFLCNENYDILNDTIFGIDEMIRVINEGFAIQQDPFPLNRLETIPIDKNVLIELKNNDFINDYFSYIRTLDKHNLDIYSINQFADSMRMARVNGNISSDNYNENMQRLVSNLELFRKFCLDSQNKSTTLLAKTRVLIKTDSNFFKRFISRFKNTTYRKSFNRKYEKELIELQKELTQVIEKSKKEIDVTLNNKSAT